MVFVSCIAILFINVSSIYAEEVSVGTSAAAASASSMAATRASVRVASASKPGLCVGD